MSRALCYIRHIFSFSMNLPNVFKMLSLLSSWCFLFSPRHKYHLSFSLDGPYIILSMFVYEVVGLRLLYSSCCVDNAACLQHTHTHRFLSASVCDWGFHIKHIYPHNTTAQTHTVKSSLDNSFPSYWFDTPCFSEVLKLTENRTARKYISLSNADNSYKRWRRPKRGLNLIWKQLLMRREWG